MNTAGTAPEWAPPAGLVLLTSGVVSSAATLAFNLTSYTSYRGILVTLYSFIPATDGVELQMQTSADGTTYDTGASDYAYQGLDQTTEAPSGINSNGTGGSSAGRLTNISLSNSAIGGVTALFTMIAFTSTTTRPKWTSTVTGFRSGGTLTQSIYSGRRNSTAAVNGVRFLFSSGNISSGSYGLYGYL